MSQSTAANPLLARHKTYFLDLPPELRNQIYSYAVEREFDQRLLFLPMLHVERGRKSPWAIEDCWMPFRQYFGLTQACWQIRAEYRPNWLRNFSTRIEIKDMPEFMRTFYGDEKTDMELPGPKLLQIHPYLRRPLDADTWTSMRDDGHTWYRNSRDLLPLLKLRSQHPSVRMQFIRGRKPPEDLLLYKLYDATENGWAGSGIWCMVIRDLVYFHIFPEPTAYVLENGNDTWLSDIREGRVTRAEDEVIGHSNSYPDIRVDISFSGTVAQNSDIAGDARSYLRRVGFDEGEWPDHLSFRVDVEGRELPK